MSATRSPIVQRNKSTRFKKILNLLLTNFRRCFTSTLNLSVDKTIVGFRGKFGPKQYIPNKPIKFGIHTGRQQARVYFNILPCTSGDTLSTMPSQCIPYCPSLLV